MGKQAFQNIQRYGHSTWFEWCDEHWNTSANALDGSVEENQLTFLSAEKPPEPIIQKISQMFPSVTIHYAWAGASLEDDCGARIYQNGAVIQENIHAGQEAVELPSDQQGPFDLKME